MPYSILESDECIQDVINLAVYMKRELKNAKAANHYLESPQGFAKLEQYFIIK